jgi:hypothetical protein
VSISSKRATYHVGPQSIGFVRADLVCHIFSSIVFGVWLLFEFLRVGRESPSGREWTKNADGVKLVVSWE